jgi:hypothetical protein
MSEQQYVEDIDDFLAGYQLPEDEVPICMRTDLQARFEQLQRELDAARRQPVSDTLDGDGGSTRQIATQIEELRTEMQSHVRVFLLRGLHHKAWSDLLGKHKPRKEDYPADHNRETFPAAALAECAIKPKMSAEKAGALIDKLTLGQWNELWSTVLELNRGSGAVPFSEQASAVLRNTRPS